MVFFHVFEKKRNTIGENTKIKYTIFATRLWRSISTGIDKFELPELKTSTNTKNRAVNILVK